MKIEIDKGYGNMIQDKQKAVIAYQDHTYYYFNKYKNLSFIFYNMSEWSKIVGFGNPFIILDLDRMKSFGTNIMDITKREEVLALKIISEVQQHQHGNLLDEDLFKI